MNSPSGGRFDARQRVRETRGFTFVELTIVIAVIGLLAAFAIPMFQNFLKKAKTVEGETALTEIKRLEEHYFSENLFYSNNLSTIGFNPTPPLKYYSVTIQLNGAGPPPFLYRATATANLDKDPDLDAWVLTLYTDGKSDILHGCIPGGVGAVQLGCLD
jgi:prepilin-type N-terminal cleavage/methylation domain-containing protein